MTLQPNDLPSDLASALTALRAEREARIKAEAVAASAQAKLSDTEALIAHLQLMVEKLKREKYGQRSERTARLIEQMELQLEDLVTTASEDELAAATAVAKAHSVRAFPLRGQIHGAAGHLAGAVLEKYEGSDATILHGYLPWSSICNLVDRRRIVCLARSRCAGNYRGGGERN